jgi:protein-L-isoaspartate O-methyltransferase
MLSENEINLWREENWSLYSAFLSKEILNEFRNYLNHDDWIVRALSRVPRHLHCLPFCESGVDEIYSNVIIPLVKSKNKYISTCSMPSLIALMASEALSGVNGSGKVLEIGAGSLYAAAIIACHQGVGEVGAVEVLPQVTSKWPEIIEKGMAVLPVEYGKIKPVNKDALNLLQENKQTYDAIVISAGVHSEKQQEVLESAKKALKIGGMLVVPIKQLVPLSDNVYVWETVLCRIERTSADTWIKIEITEVNFVNFVS